MAKDIEQTFTIELEKDKKVFIKARNYNSHYLSIPRDWMDLTTGQMRKMADFLKECADKIDADPDFKKPQS